MSARNFLFCFLLILCKPLYAQQTGIVLGRNFPLPPAATNFSLQFRDSISADSLGKYDVVFVFSSARSTLSDENILALQSFVNDGGGLYIGADNWPFVSESDQLTFAFFGKSCWGNIDMQLAKVNDKQSSNAVFADKSEIPSGQTTVSFPLDYRLKVEAWTGDEPLILSGKFGKGRIILDGGYSRFNRNLSSSPESNEVFREMMLFLSR